MEMGKSIVLPFQQLLCRDGTFSAGCLTEKTQKHHCLLTVAAEGRKSAGSGQTATCAYGAKSNTHDKRPAVILTAQDNTLALVCGSGDATTIPMDLPENYCTDQSSTCSTKGQFVALTPGFQRDWRKTDVRQAPGP